MVMNKRDGETYRYTSQGEKSTYIGICVINNISHMHSVTRQLHPAVVVASGVDGLDDQRAFVLAPTRFRG